MNQSESNEKRSPFKEFKNHPTEKQLIAPNELFIELTVPGVQENRYLVSNYGRIYDTINEYFVGDMRGSSTIINGEETHYIRRRLMTTHNFYKDYPAHRVELVSFMGIPEEYYNRKLMPNHKDFMRNNNYYDPYNPNSNLEWVTASENSKWNFIEGRQTQKGEANSCCKITEEDVIKVADLLMKGYGDIEVSKILNNPNLPPYTVANIRNKRGWTHLTTGYEFPKMKKAKMFTDEEVHRFCQYFQDTKEQNKGKMKMDIVKEAIINLGYELNDSLFNAVKLIRRRVMYKDIVSQYDY